MTGTMTWVGFDVHARSTHAAAIDVMSGELTRMRFGLGIEAPVAWLGSLPGSVRACYEAGPTGFGFYRAAVAAGIAMEVIASGKTPRGRSDRVKTDRKDAELLARCLLAGSLTVVTVPPVEVEAARELVRAHDACRRDLMNARHRRGVCEHRPERWPARPPAMKLDPSSPASSSPPPSTSCGWWPLSLTTAAPGQEAGAPGPRRGWHAR